MPTCTPFHVQEFQEESQDTDSVTYTIHPFTSYIFDPLIVKYLTLYYLLSVMDIHQKSQGTCTHTKRHMW
jgi:hypothetical protein